MQEIRCVCNKKLGMGLFIQLEIKCPRCGYLNILSAASTKPERHGASVIGDRSNAGTSRNTLAGR